MSVGSIIQMLFANDETIEVKETKQYWKAMRKGVIILEVRSTSIAVIPKLWDKLNTNFKKYLEEEYIVGIFDGTRKRVQIKCCYKNLVISLCPVLIEELKKVL